MYWTIAASAFDTVHTLPSLEFLKSRLEEICYSTRSFAKGGNDTGAEDDFEDDLLKRASRLALRGTSAAPALH
jgi:hypothetical protein